jgi:hypothetical protein
MSAAALLLAATLAAAPAPATVHRYAVLAAASRGGPDRALLQYASHDARAIAQVLDDLGGVPVGNQVRLEDPTRSQLLSAIRALEPRLAAHPGARVELFLYYSGHSDEDGLLLGDERLPYPELRQALEASRADVRIAILDSCASGAMTRKKGGTKRPPFLVDASSQVRGYAVLTSSSDTEAAQESDRIQASFFTHALVTGLRGAADIGGDGRVTLSEAYHFAFHETLARTERTQAGAQHPGYEMQLVGMGDLVMTDLRSTSAALILDSDLDGRLYLRDAKGALVAELNKPSGRTVELGLAPGAYQVTLERRRDVLGGEVRLEDGVKTPLAATSLRAVGREPTTARGPSAEYEHVPVNISLIPALSFGPARKKRQNFVLNFIWSKYAVLEGLELGTGLSVVEEEALGVQLATVGNMTLGTGAGAQLSAGFNHSSGRYVGLQLTGGFNNSAGLVGAQLSAGVNIDRGEAWALQATAGVNIADTLSGAQLSAGINVADDLWGAQVSMLNLGGGVSGAQVGLLNIGGDVRGMQVGLLNIATQRMRGLQLGLVNYAGELSGAPVGLLSIVPRGGTVKPGIWSSDLALVNVGLKLGAKHFYGILSAGLLSASARKGLTFGLGVGGHIPVSERLFVDLDLIGHRAEEALEVTEDASWILQLRLTPGYQLTEGVAVFAGPSLNVQLLTEPEAGATLRPGFAYVSGDGKVAVWPGFAAGVQFF